MKNSERTALAADSLRVSGRLRLRVRGESMLPTLWPGNVVVIERCTIEDVRAGDVVLAFHDNRFVLHRLLELSGSEGITLCGDSMPGPDPRFPPDALVGRLVSALPRSFSESAENSTLLTTDFSLRPWTRLVGKALCYCAPARHLALRLYLLWHAERSSGSMESPQAVSMELGQS